ncbi:nucleotide-binding universal stress UspA family protein [Pseudoduganella lurida]|uniref:Nucleotide-binding universal stress UspA family protein n=1 Tax=Pseudoduganella lurida TaxID=1036180 RepID=A0A562RM45_9BURK|nr:universal stress protein [Pseudoduganella lurida]TWI70128.1 nucleotide-binding universal stress UspA family protein [Pseudoduganella lurida]
MAYKTILVHLDETPHNGARVLLAAELALQHGAHVIGVAFTGVSRFLYQNEMVDDHDPNFAVHLEVLRERARRALANFAPQLQALGVHSFEERVLDDEPGAGLALVARHADLAIVGQALPGHDGGGAPPAAFPAELLTESGCPVLVVPHTARLRGAIAVDTAGVASPGAPAPGRHALIAWSASKESSRAVREALPLLAGADRITVAIVDADLRPALFGERPGDDVVAWLARHGIAARVVLAQTPRTGLLKRPGDVGETLLMVAGEHGCDLLVLGAYGHSRLRETLLGGVTRTVLESMLVPVFMAH